MLIEALPLVVVILLPVASFASPPQWKSLKPCDSSPPPATIEATEAKCSGTGLGHCQALDEHSIEVCKCKAQGSATGAMMKVFSKGRRVLSFPVETFLGDTADFEARVAKLQEAGPGETLVIANRISESNGMAVQKWKLGLLALPLKAMSQLAFRFVEDYGPGTLLTGPSLKGQCRLLDTEWKEEQGKKYFYGKVLKLVNGKLVDDPAFGDSQRRLSRIFERSRLDSSRRLSGEYQKNSIRYEPLSYLAE